MVLSEVLKTKLNRILLEQRNAERIEHNGLFPRRKLILVGPPGTGKTMTASALAGELGLPLFQIRLDGLISKYLGETAAKLRLVFEASEDTLGVYFFDEFDAVGAERGLLSDVGEARRILNSFLMMLEESKSSSLILAATNHPEILDTALYRRFDDVLTYEMPDERHIVTILKDMLTGYTDNRFDFTSAAACAAGLSYAEITKAAEEVIKTALMESRKTVTAEETITSLNERKVMKEQLRKLTVQR
jgi:SpoVK/Ycf46/Vps4 family AAA+-type ATPase